jgi:succinyl-CoA--D-citramalate CoA-transferase
MESTIPEYVLTGHVLLFVAPSNIYPTSDEDYVLIAGNADTDFGRLAEALAHAE